MGSLSHCHVSRVTSSETALAVESGLGVALPRKPWTPQTTSVYGKWTVLGWFTISSCQTGSFWSLLTKHDVKLYYFAFAHALLDLLWVAPSDLCLVGKNILACHCD